MVNTFHYFLFYLLLKQYICSLFEKTNTIRYLSIKKIMSSYNVRLYYRYNQAKYFELNLQSNISYATKHYYVRSTTISDEMSSISSSLIYANHSYSYINMSDVFEQRLNNDDIDSFNISFYYFYDDFPKYDSLSFAYYTVDPYLNVINNLYDNNQIKYKGFGIYLEDLDKSINDKIFLGSFPSKYTLNKQLSKIKIDVPSNSWAIKLNSISFGESSLIKQSIPIEQIAYFQLKVSEFYAPYSFFKELMNFISNNIHNVSCRLNAYYDGEMFCNSSDAFQLIGDLVFHVNNNTDIIVIPNNKLYKCDHERSCFLKMKQMKGDKDTMNYWMFDNQILHLYNVYFDSVNKEISFYKKSTFDVYDFALYGNYVLLSISIVFLMNVWFRMKNNKTYLTSIFNVNK